MVFLSLSTDRALTSEPLRKPNPDCHVCGVARLDLFVDIDRTTLNDVVEECLRKPLGYGESLSILHDSLIFDEEFDDNLEKELSKLAIKDGSFLTVVDDTESDEAKVNLVVLMHQK